MSVNRAWKGRLVKSREYRRYEKQMLSLLPTITLPEAPFEILFRYGFSSAASDVDNPGKPLLDILQTKYSFNDKLVYRLVQEKVKVKKGEEYLEFSIMHYSESHQGTQGQDSESSNTTL